MDHELYSYSRLSAWEQCPYGYYLTYVRHACPCGFTGSPADFKPKEADGQLLYECPTCHRIYTEEEFRLLTSRGIGNAFAEYGSFCHSLLEQYANGQCAPEDLADVYEFGFDSAFTMRFPKLGRTDLRESYYKKGLDFFRSFRGYPGCKLLAAEEHFIIPVGDFRLQGFIDLQYEDEAGRLVCQDYKSKAVMHKSELPKYARQLYLYSAYMQEKYGHFPDVLRFSLFREKKLIDIPFREEDYQEALDWAQQTVDSIRAAWQYPTEPDNFYCLRLCDQRMNCEYGSFDAWRKSS